MDDSYIESIEKNSLLFDFYGALLTERQREVMSLYHEENYSLAEIAEEYDVSRQAIYSTLKKTEQLLADYEKKLGLVGRLQKQREKILKIDRMIDELIEKSADGELRLRLKGIKSVIRED